MRNFKILALGDICGPKALDYVCKNLWNVRKSNQIDLVVCNGENCAEPNGIDRESAKRLFESGCDVITTGNHVWRKSSVFSYLDDEERILRPLNYPSSNPGHGDVIVTENGVRVLVLNVLGQAFIEGGSNPFEAIEGALSRNSGKYDFAVLDIHAEATGEKLAIAYEFCEKISVVFGTHTHVQTNDACVLSGKCAYITDLGMCGSTGGILGVKKDSVIYKMKTKMNAKFDFDDGETECCGAIFEVNKDTWQGVSCKNIKFNGEIL
jgi:hypothetical protein